MLDENCHWTLHQQFSSVDVVCYLLRYFLQLQIKQMKYGVLVLVIVEVLSITRASEYITVSCTKAA